MSLSDKIPTYDDQPIFIHSLWRSGSTYMFDVFRRSEQKFTCYQEALHEWALFGAEEPEKLLDIHKVDDFMRHPALDRPYFQELYDALPGWSSVLSKDLIYDKFFIEKDVDRYFNSLIKSSRNRPVFHETRTGGRISFLKDEVGGLHLYIWRNPRDQFWSFLKSNYFKSVLLMILNGISILPVLKQIKKTILFNEFHSQNIFDEFNFFRNLEISYNDLYKIYFALWCIYQINGNRYCSITINMNELSLSPEYRASIVADLKRYGVEQVSFERCEMPFFIFSSEELDEFSRMESEIFEELRATGYPDSEISMLESSVHYNFNDGSPGSRSIEHQLVDLRGMVRDNMGRASEQFARAQTAFDESAKVGQILADSRRDFEVLLAVAVEGRDRAVDDRNRAAGERDRALETLEKKANDFEKNLNAVVALQQEKIDELWQAHNSTLEALHAAARTREDDLQNKIKSLAVSLERAEAALQHKEAALQLKENAWQIESDDLKREILDLQSVLHDVRIHIAEGRILLQQQVRFRRGALYRWLSRRGKKWPSTSFEHRMARWLKITDFPVAFLPKSMFTAGAMTADFAQIDSCVGNGNPYLRANSVSELCAWHDLDFVRCAFVTILGRQPDADGEAYYVTRLREGVHKLSIISDLRRSVEAKRHDPGIAGLDRLLRKHKNASRPIIGWLVRMVTGREGDSDGEKRLRQLEGVVHGLQRKQAYEFSHLRDHMGSRAPEPAVTDVQSGNLKDWNEETIGRVLSEKARALLERQYR